MTGWIDGHFVYSGNSVDLEILMIPLKEKKVECQKGPNSDYKWLLIKPYVK